MDENVMDMLVKMNNERVWLLHLVLFVAQNNGRVTAFSVHWFRIHWFGVLENDKIKSVQFYFMNNIISKQYFITNGRKLRGRND